MRTITLLLAFILGSPLCLFALENTDKDKNKTKEKPLESQVEKVKKQILILLDKARKARDKGDLKLEGELKEEILKLQKELKILLFQKAPINRLTREIRRLEKMASFFKALGRTKEAEKLYKIIAQMRKTILPDPPQGPDKKRVEEIRKKAFLLTQKSLKAKEQKDYPKAFRAEEEGETLELYLQILLTKKQSPPSREEQIARLTHQIQRLLDEAVGARMRGDKLRVQELSRQIGYLKSALAWITRRNQTQLTQIWNQFSSVFKKLSKEAYGALLEGDKKRYQQIQRQIESLRKNQGNPSTSGDMDLLLEKMRKNLGPLIGRLKKEKNVDRLKQLQELQEDLERLQKLLRYLPKDGRLSLPLPHCGKKDNHSPQVQKLNRRVQQLEDKIDELQKSLDRMEKLLQKRTR